MIQHSLGVRLSWEIASCEAKNKNSSFIETGHMAIGILSIEKVLDQIRLRSEAEYKSVFIEKEDLYKVLFSFKLNPVIIRRELRKMLPAGKGLPSDTIYHRSAACKELFNEASNFSTHVLKIKHLFVAVLNKRDSYLYRLLLSEGIEIDKLKTELMFSEYKRN